MIVLTGIGGYDMLELPVSLQAFQEYMMADGDKKVDLTLIDRLWLKKALALQSKSIERSLSNELPGSEVAELRRREIAALHALTVKVS